MTATQLDEKKLRHLLGYIGLVRDSLRMQNWDVILHRTDHGKEDVWAHTWQEYNHTTLNIEISETLFEANPETVRNAIVHELTHAQHRDVSRLWEECALNNSSIPQSDSRAWDGDFRVFMERFVSWVTQRVEKTVPLYEPERRYRAPEGCVLMGENAG